MEKKAHGGLAMMDKQGQVIIGKGSYQENGEFLKEEVDSLSLNPSEAILNDMAEKGLWGSYIFASRQQEKDTIEPERTI